MIEVRQGEVWRSRKGRTTVRVVAVTSREVAAVLTDAPNPDDVGRICTWTRRGFHVNYGRVTS